MRVDLTGRRVHVAGIPSALATAALDAIIANGARTSEAGDADIALYNFELLPDEGAAPDSLLADMVRQAGEMTVRGPGRLVVLASALAALPARRHPRFSAAMARIPATLRTLAMRHAPQLLVNGVGTGPIGDPLLAGDAAMLGHASIKRPGTIGEIIDPILFFCDPANTYTTGQFLLVDGGWSAGYARSF